MLSQGLLISVSGRRPGRDLGVQKKFRGNIRFIVDVKLNERSDTPRLSILGKKVAIKFLRFQA